MSKMNVKDFADKVSLSALKKRHTPIRYALAVVIGVVALTGAAFGAQALTYQPAGYARAAGVALSDDSASDSLKKLATANEPAKSINPVNFEAGEPFFTGIGNKTYVGEDHREISSSFPLFINGGASVQTMDGEATVFTDEYDSLDTYKGLILANGYSYNDLGERIDTQCYSFLKLKSNIYVNLQALHIEGAQADIPANSLIYFDESSVAAYSLDEGVFTATRYTVSTIGDTVSFGDNHERSIGYGDLLLKLGVLSEANKAPSATEEEQQAEEPSSDTEEPKKDDSSDATVTETETKEAEPAEWKWIKPTASSTDLTPSVYNVSGGLTINDPAGVITRAIRYEFRVNGQLFMRAGFASSGDFTVGGLQPKTTYDVSAYMTYKNEEGQTVEENFFNQTITMGDPSQLQPIQLTYGQGDLYSQRLEFKDITFVGGSTELLQNASDLVFNANNKSFALSASQRTQLLNGEKVTMRTSASFDSGSSYQVSMAAADRFGNAIALQAPTLTMSTCKAEPSARMYLTTNAANRTVIGANLQDANSALTSNAKMYLYDADRNLIATRDVDLGEGSYEFSELGFDRVLHAEIVANYDIEDGKGVCENQVIGKLDFTTVSISVLGYAVFSTTVTDLTESGGTLNVSMNTSQMDSRLVALLTNAVVRVGEDTTNPSYQHQFSADEMARLKAGETLSYRMTGFKSMTVYKMAMASGAQIGDTETGVYYDVRTTNRDTEFKTLRTPPVVQTANSFVMGDRIGIDVRVVDADAVINGDTVIEIRDNNQRLVGEQRTFSPVGNYDGDYSSFLFEDLEANQPYTIRVISYNYNVGYDNSSLEPRVVLWEKTITTKEGVDGTIRLRGLDEVQGDSSHLDARLRVWMQDLWGELSPEEFHVDVYRNNTKVDTITKGFDGSSAEIDLDKYRVDRGHNTYRFELAVTRFKQNVVLDSVEFETDEPIIGISTEDELKTLPAANLRGKFILLNDIETTAGYITGSSSSAESEIFNGSIDFQGYKITLARTKSQIDNNSYRNPLFHRLGRDSEIKNAVIDFEGVPYIGSLCYDMRGHVDGIQVNLNPVASRAYDNVGGIVRNVSASGVLENFAVNLGGDVRVTYTSGGAVSSNSGIVRNGYVYGGRMVTPDNVPNDVGTSNIGGVVGYSYGSSRVEGVISMVDVVAPSDRTGTNYGLAIGYTSGRAQGVLATGTLENYYGRSSNERTYGPTIGYEPTPANAKNVYYTNKVETSNNAWNSYVSALALYDGTWYQNNTDPNGQFDTTPVLRECYPHVNMAKTMPAQPYLPLPTRPEVYKPTITTTSVTEQTDDYAKATISFSNKDAYTINSISVASLRCEIESQEQDVDDPTITRVKVRLSNPGEYLTGYSIMGISYSPYQGNTEYDSYATGEYVVDAEFYRVITTASEWKGMNGKYENYRLGNDIDFAKGGNAYLGSFNGKLDGNGYAIRNMTNDDSTRNGRIIDQLKGTVSNLTVSNYQTTAANHYYGTVIGYAMAGSVVDGVRVEYSTMEGYCRIGGVVGYANNAVVRNCSVANTTLKSRSQDGNSIYMGGIVAQMDYTEVLNCYVQDVAFDGTNAYAGTGVGGMVGYMAGASHVEHGYAVGSIKASTMGVGGIVGYSASDGNVINSVWSKVSIDTPTSVVGGLIGRSATSAPGSVNGLAIGDIYVSAKGLSDIDHVLGRGTMPTDAYYYAGQQVSGLEDSTRGTALDATQLSNSATYTEVIGMSGFDAGQAGSGILPKVYGTDGTLLAGQVDNYFDNATIKVTSMEASQNGSAYQLQYTVEHPAGVTITGSEFDYLTPAVDPVIAPQQDGTHTVLYYSSVTPQKAFDTYCLEKVNYKNASGQDAQQEVKVRIDFGTVVYKTIGSIADWKNKVDPNGYENYQITGDIDFSGLNETSGNMGVKVGRLDGLVDSNGHKPQIMNIDVTFSANSQKSLVDEARVSVANIGFTNIKIQNANNNTDRGLSIIRSVNGSGKSGGMRNVDFNNIEITAQPNSSNSIPSRVGCISRLGGSVDSVSLKDVKVTANSGDKHDGLYYGCLFGYGFNTSTVTNVTGNGLALTVSGRYAGGIGGRTEGTSSDIEVTNAQIEAEGTSSETRVGGVLGYMDANGTRLKVTGSGGTDSSVKVIGGKKDTGGVAGCGRLYDSCATGVYVEGETNVGGLCGYGYALSTNTSNSPDESQIEKFSRAINCTVSGTGDQSSAIGGAVGSHAWASGHGALAKGNTVTGHTNVGGYSGYSSNYVSACYAQDNTVTGTGDYVGGLIGYSAGGLDSCGSDNNTVSGGNYVGGGVGSGSYYHCSYVTKATVNGNNNVGGAIGEMRSRSSVSNILSNAAVTASGNNVGGIIGLVSPEYSDVVDNARLTSSIFTGSVSGNENVGGIVGLSKPGYVSNLWYGFMVSGSVTGASNVGFAVGATGNADRNSLGSVEVHGAATLNGTRVTKGTAANMVGSTATPTTVVSKADITTASNACYRYLNGGTGNPPGLNLSGWWDSKGNNTGWFICTNKWLETGKFPASNFNVNGTRQKAPFQSDVAVPEGNVIDDTAQTTSAEGVATQQLPSINDAEGVNIYASGVNTFNVEFGANMQGMSFSLSSSDGTVVASSQAKAVVTDSSGATDEDASAAGNDGAATSEQLGNTAESDSSSDSDSVAHGAAREADDEAVDSAQSGATEQGSAEGDTDSSSAGASTAATDGKGNSDGSLLSGTIANRTYTFAYDFQTPLTLTVSSFDGTRSYAVDPSALRRSVAVWGSDAYYLTEDGVRSLNGDTVAGSYVNLFDGMALGSDGAITHIADVGGSYAPATASPVASVADARPLFQGSGWETFWSYTAVSGDTQRDMRLYPCGSEGYAVSSELDTVADGFVFADADGKHFRTVLMADGTLSDLADALVYPSNFKNEGIKSMTNTAYADANLVVVRYESGGALCFDYTTGEVKFQKQESGDDQGLLDYASDFFASQFGDDSDAQATGDKGYSGALSLEEKASHGIFAGLGDGSGSGSSASSAAGGFSDAAGYLSVYEPSKGGYVTYSKSDVLSGATGSVSSLNQKYGVAVSADKQQPITTVLPAGSVGSQAGGAALFGSAVLGIAAILLFL